jgi:Methylamine utilisation protein MauE
MGAVAVAAQVVVVVVLVAAAAGKLRARNWPAGAGLPDRRWVAVGLPVAELAVALLAVPPVSARVGLAAAAALFAVLAAGVAVVARTRAGARCACFGRQEEPLGGTHVVRNLALTVVALAGAAAAGGSPSLPQLVVGAGYGVPLALLVLSWAELTALTRGVPLWRT